MSSDSLESYWIVDGQVKVVRPKIMFDDSVCDSQVCDDWPPANIDVFESVVTCS